MIDMTPQPAPTPQPQPQPQPQPAPMPQPRPQPQPQPQPQPAPTPQPRPQPQPQPQPQPAPTPHPQSVDAYTAIIEQQQAQIAVLVEQNAALNGQVTQLVQGGAQFSHPEQQTRQAQQANVPQFPNVYEPLGTETPHLVPSLSDDADYSMEGLAGEIGKRNADEH